MRFRTLLSWIQQNKILSCVIGVALLALLIGIFRFRSSRADFGTLSDPIKKGTLIESVYGIGTVTARNSFNFKVGVTSTVLRLFVKEGDRVNKGDSLIELDSARLVRAPFAGTITFLPANIGETVFAQSVVLSLVDLVDRYVVVSLEQRGAVRVRQGQKARLSFDSMREQVFDGSVQSIYSNEANFLVRIGVSDLPPQLLPGMTADVAIAIGERKDVLVVPAAAITENKVYVERASGGPKAIDVSVGLVDGDKAEIVSGDLKEGDRVYIRKKVGS